MVAIHAHYIHTSIVLSGYIVTSKIIQDNITWCYHTLNCTSSLPSNKLLASYSDQPNVFPGSFSMLKYQLGCESYAQGKTDNFRAELATLVQTSGS